MLNNTQKSFINHLCNFLPDRRPGKRGTKPIPKKILVEQLLIKIKFNLPWNAIKQEHAEAILRKYKGEACLKNSSI